MPNSTASYAAAEFAHYEFSHSLQKFRDESRIILLRPTGNCHSADRKRISQHPNMMQKARPADGQMGRPSRLTDAQKAEARQRLAQGATLSELARGYDVIESTISRLAGTVLPCITTARRGAIADP